uniref:Uncharacterized protein n=1 Tax=Anguilla anguilla TaxID=7936 RepID=A0A0E9XMP8_ANGAN
MKQFPLFSELLTQSQNYTSISTNLKHPCQTQIIFSKTYTLPSKLNFAFKWHTQAIENTDNVDYP